MPHGGAAGLPGDRGFRVIEGASAKKYLSPLGRCGRRSRTRTASRRLVLVLSRSSEHSFVGVRSSLGVTGISHGLSGLTTGSEFPRRGTRLGSKPTPISCPPPGTGPATPGSLKRRGWPRSRSGNKRSTTPAGPASPGRRSKVAAARPSWRA